MTAAVAVANLDDLGDADLVRDSLAGDRDAFAQIYDRYADRLHDYCLRMLRDRDGAADCVQEAFYVAGTRLLELRQPDRLRPWLYAIARNEALARLRQRRRETPFDELPDVESLDPTPDKVAARTELADLIATAANGLSDRDRVVFDLAFRHGLSGPDIADALEISLANANKLVLRLRRTVLRALGAVLLSRRARSAPGGCAELGEILAGWDGELTVLMRKRISRHVESCRACDDEQQRMVNPTSLLASTPIFVAAPDWLRESTLDDVQLTCHGAAMATRRTNDAHARRPNRRWLWFAGWLLAVLGASAGLTFAWNPQPIATPSEVSDVVPQLDSHPPAQADVPPAPADLPPPVIPPAPMTQPPPHAPGAGGHVPQPSQPQVLTEAPPQVPVVLTPEAIGAKTSASSPTGPPRIAKPATAFEPERDTRGARRFPAAQSAGDSSNSQRTATSQGSSAANGSPSSEPRRATSAAPAAESDSDADPPAARRSVRDAPASQPGQSGRRATPPR